MVCVWCLVVGVLGVNVVWVVLRHSVDGDATLVFVFYSRSFDTRGEKR